MPLAFAFADPSTLAVRASGTVTFDEVEDVIRDLITDARFARGVRVIADCREVEQTLSTAELRTVARDIRPLVAQGMGPVAVITSSVFMFGITRMFGTFAETVGAHVHAVRTVDEANEWLATQAPAA
jgi:hypothetical protein